MTEQQWRDAWDTWAQLTPEQRADLARLAFSNTEPEPF